MGLDETRLFAVQLFVLLNKVGILKRPITHKEAINEDGVFNKLLSASDECGIVPEIGSEKTNIIDVVIGQHRCNLASSFDAVGNEKGVEVDDGRENI